MFTQFSIPFLLSLTLYLGIAAQGAGLYLFGWVALIAIAAKKLDAGEARTQFAKALLILGASLLGMWLIFLLGNWITHFQGPSERLQAFINFSTIKVKLNSSHLPSTVAVSGALLMIGSVVVSRLSPRNPQLDTPSGTNVESSQSSLYLNIQKGFLLASLLVLPYFALQTATGLDYRAEGGIMLPEHRMQSGFYRLFGLYGHPLSMAGAALAWCSFFWTQAVLFLSNPNKSIQADSQNQTAWKRFLNSPLQLCLANFLVTFVYLLFTGGRTATVAMFLLFF